jgi:hypothetical protein
MLDDHQLQQADVFVCWRARIVADSSSPVCLSAHPLSLAPPAPAVYVPHITCAGRAVLEWSCGVATQGN